MAYEFRFPDVGEGIHEGEVVSWKVKVGDKVNADQVIAEVQTDKALVEIPSPKTGIILRLNVDAGEKIKVGDVFCVIGENGEKVNEGIVGVQQKTMQAQAKERKQIKGKQSLASQMKPTLAVQRDQGVVATPHTRQLARALGVNISTIVGTGPVGRVTDEDVKNATRTDKTKALGKPVLQTMPPSAEQKQQKHMPTVTFEKWGSLLRIPIKGIRKATYDRMAFAWKTIPHVTHMDEADVTELSKRREKEKLEAEKKGYKLTFLPFIAKAIIAGLKLHPYFNSSVDDAAQEIITRKYYNIGIAVDTSNGLMVPNIKNADKLSILELAREMQTLAEKCRDRSITIEELQGGTFTITNVGSFGGMMATPIINHPEVAILGVGAIRDKPVARENKVVIRKMMPLFLSFDHRVVDGAAAAKFLNDVIKHLEDPDLMLVDVV